MDYIEVIPNSDDGAKKKARVREPLYIARGVELEDSSSNTLDAILYDRAGNSAGATQRTGINLDTSVGWSYVYDGNGCMTHDGVYDYIYDYENRLVNVRDGGNIIWTSVYDAPGRRIMKETGGVTAIYIYDGENLIQTYDGENSLVAEYVHGSGIDNVLRADIHDGENVTAHYYHKDGMGSASELTDEDGAPAQAYEYDAWGNPTIYDPSSGIENPFLYTGREWDGEISLYYYRARHYAPQIGRFLQPDKTYNDGENLYIYGKNVPIWYSDPSVNVSITHKITVEYQEKEGYFEYIYSFWGRPLGTKKVYTSSPKWLIAKIVTRLEGDVEEVAPGISKQKRFKRGSGNIRVDNADTELHQSPFGTTRKWWNRYYGVGAGLEIQGWTGQIEPKEGDNCNECVTVYGVYVARLAKNISTSSGVSAGIAIKAGDVTFSGALNTSWSTSYAQTLTFVVNRTEMMLCTDGTGKNTIKSKTPHYVDWNFCDNWDIIYNLKEGFRERYWSVND